MHGLGSSTDDELLVELDHLERLVARTAAQRARSITSGPAVDDDLLALVERAHTLVQELRHRRRGGQRPAGAR